MNCGFAPNLAPTSVTAVPSQSTVELTLDSSRAEASSTDVQRPLIANSIMPRESDARDTET